MVAPESSRRRLGELLQPSTKHGEDWQVRTTSAGRGALRLALEYQGAGPGRKVVISTFNCPAVIDAVLATGAQPLLVDAHPVKGPAFDEVDVGNKIVVLTFGLGLDEWKLWGRSLIERGAELVLDLAQASPDRATLNRFACARLPMVLSFGPSKVLGAPGGGAALFPPNGHRPVREPSGSDSDPGPRALLIAIARYMRLRGSRRTRRRAEARERASPGWSTTKADHLPIQAQPVVDTGPSPTLEGMLPPLLHALNKYRSQEGRIREQVVSALVEDTSPALEFRCVGDASGAISKGLELVFARPGQRYEFSRELAAHGIQSGWNYVPLHRQEPYLVFGKGRSFPGAEGLWPRVLTIPIRSQPRMSAERLLRALLRADARLKWNGGVGRE